MTIVNQSLQAYKDNAAAIDLESVKFRLMRNDGWTRERADAVDPLYKGYLLLTAVDAPHALVPSKDVDAMWHTHILDTQKYSQDCQAAFGRFIHHIPARVERSPEEVAAATEAFDQTKKLLRQVIGFDFTPNMKEPAGGTAAICQGKGDSECFAGISPSAASASICQGKGDSECFAGISQRSRNIPQLS